MLIRLQTFLRKRMDEYAVAALESPPDSMEKLMERVGRYRECGDLMHEVEQILKGFEHE